MSKEAYLTMCEQLNKEPDPREIPPAFEDFPTEVQTAMIIYSTLPDVWESFGGNYLGKDYSVLPYLANQVYEITDHPLLMHFLTHIDKIVSDNRAAKLKQQQNKNKRHKK